MKIWTSVILCIALTATGAAFANKTPVKDRAPLVLHSTLRGVTGANSGIAAAANEIQPGETFAITGDCVANAGSADDLRVVLTLADPASQPGFRSVMAIDKRIQDNALEVRVPDMPETVNRVFNVRIFRLGQVTPGMCDAGSIRIGGGQSGKVG